MTSEVYPLHGRLNDVLRTLRRMSTEGTLYWKEYKIIPDNRAEHIRFTLASRGNQWANACDARAVSALLYYLRKRVYLRDVSPDVWDVDTERTVQSSAEFPEPAIAVRCNRLLGALRNAARETEASDELRVVIAGNLHAHLVGLLIDHGEYWAEGYRFSRAGSPNSVRQSFDQLVRRRLIRSEPAAASKGCISLMVRSQGQF